MEVSYFMIAAHAEIQPDGKLYVLSGDLDSLRIPIANFPATATLPFYVVGQITFPEAECDIVYQGRIEVVAPDGTVLQGVDSPVRPPPPAVAGRFSKAHFLVALAGFTFPTPGDFQIRLILDGRNLKTIPMYIEQLPPEA